MYMFRDSGMFILALVALSIIGFICVGLLVVIIILVLVRKNERGGPPKIESITPAILPPDVKQPTNQDILDKIDKLDKESRIGTSFAMFGIALAIVLFATDILKTNWLRGLVGVLLGYLVFFVGTPTGRKWVEKDKKRANLFLLAFFGVMAILFIISIFYVKPI